MAKPIDLTGKRFGRLIVVSRAANKGTSIRWNCLCDCGETSLPHSKSLRNGTTQSCGCLKREIIKAGANRSHGRTDTSEYRAWTDIKTRCFNRNREDWPHWGGRGITICSEWRDDFAAFFEHVGPRPSAQHSIDRRDNERGYEPGNVRWATYSEQNLNRRKFKRTGYRHVTNRLSS